MGKAKPSVANAMSRPAQLYQQACEAIENQNYPRALFDLSKASAFFQTSERKKLTPEEAHLSDLIFIKQTELLLGFISQSFDDAGRACEYYQVKLSSKKTGMIALYINALPDDFPLIPVFLTQLEHINQILSDSIRELKDLEASIDSVNDKLLIPQKNHLKKGEIQTIKKILLTELTAVWRQYDAEIKISVMESLPAIILNQLIGSKHYNFFDSGYILRSEQELSRQIREYLHAIIPANCSTEWFDDTITP